MMDLRDLYQEVILDHNRSPRNFRAIEGANRLAEGFNPLCGDKVTVYALVSDDGLITDLAFQGAGCAISTASASVMTETLKGRSLEDAEAIFTAFHDLVTGDHEHDHSDVDLGKLEVFAGVAEYPARVKCASLCWHTLRAALHRAQDPVTTE
jgi:nitrogen fixation NifU-like protein